MFSMFYHLTHCFTIPPSAIDRANSTYGTRYISSFESQARHFINTSVDRHARQYAELLDLDHQEFAFDKIAKLSLTYRQSSTDADRKTNDQLIQFQLLPNELGSSAMICCKILAFQLTSGTYKLSHIAIINNALGILSHNSAYRIPITSCMGLHCPTWTEIVQHLKKTSNCPTQICFYHQHQPVYHTTKECSLNPNSHTFGKSMPTKRTNKDKPSPTTDQKSLHQIHLSSTTLGTKTSTNLASIT
eukprot:Ihof_evm1s1090 gene=Ihof_evmTU1s1090